MCASAAVPLSMPRCSPDGSRAKLMLRPTASPAEEVVDGGLEGATASSSSSAQVRRPQPLTLPSNPISPATTGWALSPASGVVGPATATAAKAASAAAALLEEIRQLRQGAALAASCDAALAAKFERIQRTRVKELHGRKVAEPAQSGALQRGREAEVNMWLHDADRWDAAMCAVSVATWRELASRQRAVEEFLAECSILFLIGRAFDEWYAGAGQQKMTESLKLLKDNLEHAQRAADLEMAMLQARYLHVKTRTTKGCLEMSLGMRSSGIEGFIMNVWTRYWRRGQAERQMRINKMRKNVSAMMINSGMQVLNVLQKWHEVVKDAKRHERVLGVMQSSMRSIAQKESRGLLKDSFRGWLQDIVHKKNNKVRETRRSTALIELNDAYTQAQEKQRATKNAFKDKTIKAMLENVEGGLFYAVLKGWRDALALLAAESAAQGAVDEFSEVETTRKQQQLAQAYHILKSRHALHQRLAPLCFAIWHCGPQGREFDRLQELAAAHGRATVELQAVQDRIVEQRKVQALDLFVCTARLQVTFKQHTALQQWRLGSERLQATSLRSYAAKQPALVQVLRTDVDLLNEEALEQRYAAARAIIASFTRWRLCLCHRVLCVWATAAHVLKKDADWDSRTLELEAERLALSAQEREQKGKLARLALAMNASADGKALGSMVLQAWAACITASRADRELEALQEKAARQQTELQRQADSRQQSAHNQGLAFMVNSLGSPSEPVERGMVMREWRAVAVQLRMQRKYEERRRLVNRDKFELCDEVGDFIDSLAVIYCFFCWALAKNMGRLERDHQDAEEAAFLRRCDARRLRATVQLRAWFTSEGDALDQLDQCFSAWHKFGSIAALDSSCQQVCKMWDERLNSARTAAFKDKTSAGSALAACFNSAQGGAHLQKLIAVLYFPTWRRLAETERHVREMLAYEEASLVQLQRMREHTAFRQRRYGVWAAGSQPRARECLAELQVLYGWRWTTASLRLQRSRQIPGVLSLLAADSMLRGSNRRMRRVVFVAWRRAHGEGMVLTLEERVQKLEMRLARAVGGELDGTSLAQLSPPSSEEASSEEASDDDDGSGGGCGFSHRTNGTRLTTPSVLRRDFPSSARSVGFAAPLRIVVHPPTSSTLHWLTALGEREAIASRASDLADEVASAAPWSLPAPGSSRSGSPTSRGGSRLGSSAAVSPYSSTGAPCGPRSSPSAESRPRKVPAPLVPAPGVEAFAARLKPFTFGMRPSL